MSGSAHLRIPPRSSASNSISPWLSPPAPPILPPAARRARLDAVIQAITRQSSTNGWLANFPSPLYHQLGQSLAASSVPAITAAIVPFLGLGRGLTPSGDDLTCGLLLTLNRFGAALAPQVDCAALNAAVLPQAYARTTLLSANLIECASRGQADERLLTALDGLMSGKPEAVSCAALLAGYGNSSGLDALAGMALAICPV